MMAVLVGPPPPDTAVLSTAEVAERLGCSQRRVLQLVSDPESLLVAWRPGSRYVFDASSVAAELTRRPRRASQSSPASSDASGGEEHGPVGDAVDSGSAATAAVQFQGGELVERLLAERDRRAAAEVEAARLSEVVASQAAELARLRSELEATSAALAAMVDGSRTRVLSDQLLERSRPHRGDPDGTLPPHR